MMSRVENVLNDFSKHVLSELDKENAELEKKSAQKTFNDYYRKKFTS